MAIVIKKSGIHATLSDAVEEFLANNPPPKPTPKPKPAPKPYPKPQEVGA